jgi:hypothetical protein
MANSVACTRFQGDLHGEQRRLHPVLTGHHLRHRHRGVTENPD